MSWRQSKSGKFIIITLSLTCVDGTEEGCSLGFEEGCDEGYWERDKI